RRGSDNAIWYEPTGRFGKTYEPVSSLKVMRATPVSVCVAVISAPGKTAPLWSFTVPLICAVAPCPAAVTQVTAESNTRSVRSTRMCFIDLLPRGKPTSSFPFRSGFNNRPEYSRSRLCRRDIATVDLSKEEAPTEEELNAMDWLGPPFGSVFFFEFSNFLKAQRIHKIFERRHISHNGHRRSLLLNHL